MAKRKQWTEELLEASLREFIGESTRLPTVDEFRAAGRNDLVNAMSRRGGTTEWASRLGLSMKLPRVKWTEAEIKTQLLPLVEQFGRMPTADEIRLYGDPRLAVTISRKGGFRHWAQKLGLRQSEGIQHRGSRWERHEEAYFRSFGWDVESMSTLHPFDLRVNGLVVDVKSATWREYRSRTGWVRGYVFSGLKSGADCDVFDVLCLSDEGELQHRYIIPSKQAQIQTLTITQRSLDGYGKYAPYLDALEHLAP